MPPPTKADLAEADRAFDFFLCAQTLKTILGYHRTICDALGLRPGPINTFYPPLKKCLTGWKAASLWKKFDARASRRCYAGGRAGASPVLIVGAGPCGLRAAIEAQFLGLRVVVVEKRDRFSRNNVLHLWPFVIEDLRALGAKKFFGKFCAGAIDHISIRQLQCILLKVALLLGVEVFCEVGFEDLVEPEANYRRGWRGKYTPIDHPLHEYEFDVIIGADGKRNTLEGFKRKEFRGKLAIAITVNFINKKTEAEARVEEISGVAFIFNQKFFKDLHEQTRIDLENIVYYKDDTHYFVMTAKKASLLEKGVIKEDMNDTEKLLAPENVDSEALQNYAREAADFSTNYQMPDLEFAVNHYGQPDIAMFDFTSMYAAEYASKVMNRNNVRLLMLLVGDSLLEPFWPTGSGCARGFLSAYDAVWAIRDYVLGSNLLTVLAERESSYRLLAQTTPDNLNKDWKSFGLSPHTRYPNFNRHTVKVSQVFGQVDSDNPQLLENLKEIISKRLQEEENVNVSNKRKREKINNEILLSWFVEQLEKHESIVLTDLSSVFKSGNALCAIINKYRPDLIDYEAVKDLDAANMNQLAFEALENAFGIVPVMTGEESVDVDDYLTMASYLTQIYDVFRGEIPHIKHPKLTATKNLQATNISKTKIICKPMGVKKYKIIKLKKRKTETYLNDEFNKSLESVFSNSNLRIKKKSKICVKNKKSPVLSTIPEKVDENVQNDIEFCKKCEENSIKNNTFNICHVENMPLPKIPFSENRLFSSEIPLKQETKHSKILSTNSSENSIEIRIIEKKSKNRITFQKIQFKSSLNLITISSKSKVNTLLLSDNNRTRKKFPNFKFNSDREIIDILGSCRKKSKVFNENRGRKMSVSGVTNTHSIAASRRVSDWVYSQNFEDTKKNNNAGTIATNFSVNDYDTDITSVTRTINKNKLINKSSKGEYDDVIVEERTDIIKCESPISSSDENIADLKKFLTEKKDISFPKCRKQLRCEKIKSTSEPAPQCSQYTCITENEENELPQSKENSLKNFKVVPPTPAAVAPSSRPSSRHKRHVDAVPSRPYSVDKKTRKRRPLERLGSSVTVRVFMNYMSEAILVGFMLFFFDILLNAEQYGFQNLIFSH